MHDQAKQMMGWFAGPKAENGEWFSRTIATILDDHYYWRRNYFPEDGRTIDSAGRRASEPFIDGFEEALGELLAKLKGDLPFHSPRYAAHMLAEQTLPAIAGYFAGMLYNPNNVSADAAPVTVALEIEASQMIARMLGYGEHSWAHLTSGGTLANIGALWMARTVLYLPFVNHDMRLAMGLETQAADPKALLRMSPDESLAQFAKTFAEAAGDTPEMIAAYRSSTFNVVEQGLGPVVAALNSRPILLAPETQHYSIKKALDLLGLGRGSLVTVRVDPHFRMDVDDLRVKLDEIDRSGNHVLAVIPIVGTTEEGAIDPVHQIVALRKEREAAGLGSFWIHADAAYGGYLRTVTLPTRLGLGEPSTDVLIDGVVRNIPLDLPVGASCDALESLGECDSITIDPHKLGYIPYPAGAVCFKSDIVKPLARQHAPYIEDAAGDVETERNSDSVGVYIVEGSKPGAAAAAVWLSHKLIPLDKTGHGMLMQEGIRNACELHALLSEFPALRGGSSVRAVPLCPPGSNIVCYAFRTEDEHTLKEINVLNQLVYRQFSVSAEGGRRIYDQPFFVSRTFLTSEQYAISTVKPFLDELGVTAEDYEREGVFLLRSVLMNPWYRDSKSRGHYFISELVNELYLAASAAALALAL